MIGITAGCPGWRDIADYFMTNAKIVLLLLPNMPCILCPDTIARAVAQINPAELCDSFIKIAACQMKAGEN
jgi:hypothetical protein